MLVSVQLNDWFVAGSLVATPLCGCVCFNDDYDNNSLANQPTNQLAVAESRLGVAIKEGLDIQCKAGGDVFELMRGVRAQITNLVTDVTEKELNTMSLGVGPQFVS